MGRKVASWIDGFIEYANQLPSPLLHKRWAAIALIAGALERRVWIDAGMGPLYPNLYTVLCAPPGVGKTALTARVWTFWNELEHLHLASSSVTKASLIDELTLAKRSIVRPQDKEPVKQFNSLLVASNELGVLIPGYENDFMNTLTDIYDGHPYSERRRTNALHVKMDAPQLNMIAATTPSYLNNVMPEGAWDQGFISRVILVYSGESTLQPLFQSRTLNEKLESDLIDDLKSIVEIYGGLKFSPTAAEAITAWHLAGGPPAPEHPRLVHYLTRRTAHLLKLCCIASISAGDSLIVEQEHYEEALSWLLEVERYMPDIFKAMKAGGDSKAIEAAWHYVYELWVKKKEPMKESRLVHFLQERIPAHNVDRVLQVMVKAEILIPAIDGNGQRTYKPAPKRTG